MPDERYERRGFNIAAHWRGMGKMGSFELVELEPLITGVIRSCLCITFCMTPCLYYRPSRAATLLGPGLSN
jgi:hypothetical protein